MNTIVAYLALFLLLCTGIHGVSVGHPIKAIYVDWHLNWNTPQQSVLDAVNAGYNVIIISFYLSGGTAADMAQAWAALDSGTKQSTIATAHSKGAVVLVSLGGSTDSPYDKDPTAVGQAVANWAKAQYLDGVDFDLENFNQGFTAGSMNSAQTVNWVATISKAAASTFGSGAIISHAPQGPYFGPIGATNTWAGATGGYTGVEQQAGGSITFYNVQFYNQGASCYTDYNGLFINSGASCPVFPSTSVSEINRAGVPLSKIVVGKPVTTADASNGWLSGSDLKSFFSQASSSLGWNTGAMGWVWNDATTCQNWIQSIYGTGSSNSGVTAATSATSATTAATTHATVATATVGTASSSTTGSSSSCSGRADGWQCIDSGHFAYCSGGSGTVQACGAGTTCQTVGSSFTCGN